MATTSSQALVAYIAIITSPSSLVMPLPSLINT